MSDDIRMSAIVAELRASELVVALRHAINGAPHWRLEGRRLLDLIDNGWLPEKFDHTTQDAA